MAQEILGQGLFKVSFQANTAQMAAFSNQMKSLGGQAGALNGVFSGMQAKTVNFTANMKGMGQATANTSQNLGQFSKDMFFASAAVGAMTTAVGLLGKSIVNLTFDFDRNMTLVKAVTGAAGEEFNDLSAAARKLGQETEFGATKAAEGLLVLSRMGLNAADSMNVLTPAVKLAQSQQHGLKETTELVVQQLRVFNKGTEEAGKFANVLAATSSKSAADMEKLSLSLSFVGPVAQATGRSFEEVNATLGLMFNAGIRASRAGTSLRFAFANLLKPTKRVNTALDKIGLTVKDVSPAMNNMDSIFRKLAKATDGVTDKASLFFDIFGKRAAPAMAAVINTVQQNNDAFTEMQAKITGTREATRQFDIQMQSFSGQALRLRSSIQEVGLQLGDALLPALKSVVNIVQGLTDWFKQLPEGLKSFIVVAGAATVVVGTLVTGLTAAAWAIGIISKSALSTVAGMKAMNVSFKENAINTLLAANAQNVFTGALSQTAAQAARNALINKGINKTKAQSIVSNALLAASNKKLAVDQIAAFKASLGSQAAQLGLNKAQTAGIVNAANLTIHNKGLTSSYQGQIIGINGATVATTGFKTAVQGAWAAIGGLTGALTLGLSVALPFIVGAFFNAKAGAKALREEQERLAESAAPLVQKYSELGTELAASKQKQSDYLEIATELQRQTSRTAAETEAMTKALKNYDDEVDRSEVLVKQQTELLNTLARDYPKLIAGYDAENNALVFKLETLEKIAAAEQGGFGVTELDARIAIESDADKKITLLKAAIQGLRVDAKVAAGAMVEFGDDIKVAEDKIKNLNFESGSYSEKLADLRADIKKANLEQDKAALGVDKYRRQLDKYQKMLDKLEGSQKKVLENEPIIPDTGDGVEKATLRFDSLNKSLLKLLATMNEAARASLSERSLIGAGAFDKSIAAEKEKFLKLEAKLTTQLTAAKLKLKAAEAKADEADEEGRVIDTEGLEQARLLVDLLGASLDGVLEIVKKTKEEKIEFLTTQQVRDLNRNLLKVKSDNKKIANDITKVWKDTTAAEIRDIKIASDARAEAIRQDIQDRKDKLSKVEEIAEAEEALNREKQEQLLLLAKETDEKILNAKLRGLEKISAVEERNLNIRSRNQGDRLKLVRNNLREEVEMIAAAGKLESDLFQEKLDEMTQAEREFLDHRISQWAEVARSLSAALSIAFEDDFFDFLESAIDDVISIIEGIASEDYVQALASAASLIASIVQEISDAADEDEQKDKERAEREAEREEERRKIWIEQRIAFDDLREATRELRTQFVDLIRDVTGLGSSLEDADVASFTAARLLQDSVEGLVGIAPEAGAPGQFDLTTIQNFLSETLKNIVDQEDPDSLNILAAGGDQALAHILGPLSTAIVDGQNSFAEQLENTLIFMMSQRTGLTAADIREQIQAGTLNIAGELFQGANITAIPDFISSLAGFAQAVQATDLQTQIYGDFGRVGDTPGAGNIFQNDPIPTGEEALRRAFASMVEIAEDYRLNVRSGETYDLRNVIDPNDMLAVIEEVFDRSLANADSAEDVAAAFAEKVTNLGTFQQLGGLAGISQGDILDLKEFYTDAGGIRTAAQEEATQTAITRGMEPFQTAADDIVNAFELGAFTFEEAVDAIALLEGEMSDLPASLQDALSNILLLARGSLLTESEAQAGAAGAVSSTVANETERFADDISSINDEMQGVIDNWQGLIDKRQDVIDTFQTESNKLVEDSKTTVANLQAQKNEILGIFDFSETQSVRSKRFQKAAEVEGKIRDEVERTAEALTKLTEKYEEDLIKIDDSLQELINTYGTMDGVYESFAIKRNQREQEYRDFLIEQLDILDKMGIVIGSIAQTNLASLSGSGLAGIGSVISGGAAAAGVAATDAGGTTLGDVDAAATGAAGDAAVGSTASAVGGLVSSSGQIVPEGSFESSDGTVRTQAEWDRLREDLVNAWYVKDNMVSRMGLDPAEAIGWADTAVANWVAAGGSQVAGNWVDPSGYLPLATILAQMKSAFNFDNDWRFPKWSSKSDDGFGTISYGGSLTTADNQAWDPAAFWSQFTPPVSAATGFSGLVSSPTSFVAGEGGRSEFVNITPLNDVSEFESGMVGGGQTTIIIEEHIDLRGAYGIDSPATAARVWEKVWAPARREAVNKVMDMRGKVQR